MIPIQLILALTLLLALPSYAGTYIQSRPLNTQIPYISMFGEQTPQNIDGGEDVNVAVGVRFTSDVPGLLYGLRFYKSPSNTGTHIGTVWSIGGTLLSSVTFTNETASGWQQMLLPTPVSIVASTLYVIAYHAPIGHYSYNLNMFLGGGVDIPPFHIPIQGGDFGYGIDPYVLFPNQPSNHYYWVDVMFVPTP